MTFQVVWDWIILGLTFYTVVMVPYNLAIKRTFGNEDITLQVHLGKILKFLILRASYFLSGCGLNC